MWIALTLAALSLFQQPSADAPRQGDARSVGAPTQVAASELSLEVYRPQHVEVGDLTRLAQQMVGRNLFVLERGGFSSEPVFNLQRMGDSLILYDTPEYLKRMHQMLDVLDRADASGDAAATARVETWEYTPSYLSLNSAYELLQPLRRPVDNGSSQFVSAPGISSTSNINVSQERRLIVVRDTSDRVKEIRDLLKRVDVPADQVTITCWLLQGTSAGSGAGGTPVVGQPFGETGVAVLPELAQHLGRLLPGQGFRQIGFALLQSSVSTDRPIQVQLEATPERSFRLDLQPTAFDRESGALTVGSCSLSSAGLGDERRLFSTATTLRGGEFTVIGASGSNPILVAIRVTAVGG